MCINFNRTDSLGTSDHGGGGGGGVAAIGEDGSFQAGPLLMAKSPEQ